MSNLWKTSMEVRMLRGERKMTDENNKVEQVAKEIAYFAEAHSANETIDFIEEEITRYFIENAWTEEYKKVLKHRKNCKDCQKLSIKHDTFCLEGFGGGLKAFNYNVMKKVIR